MLTTRPTEMTEGQVAEVIEWLRQNCSLAELRRRQDLIEVQIGQAYKQKNTEALDDLRTMEKHLREAVLGKTGV